MPQPLVRCGKWTALGALLALALSPGIAEAQREIRGTLRDELGRRGAIAGAEVRVVSAGHSVWTDSAGRFVVQSLTDGPLRLAYWAPWLDSLQLPPLHAQVESSDGVATVQLSTPGFAEYFLTRCGYRPQPEDALLVGELLIGGLPPDSPTVVAAQWNALTVDGSSVTTEQRATIDTVSADGTFALCGVPHGELVELRAAGRTASGPLLRLVKDRIMTEHWVAGSSPDTLPATVITGRALRPNGEPIVNTTVEFYGDTTSRVQSGPDGSFQIGPVSARSRTLVLRSIGSLEARVDVRPLGGTLSLGDITLEPIPASLEPVLIEADFYAREREGFESRRRGAAGFFITDEMLKGMPQVSVNTLVGMIPRVRMAGSRLGTRGVLQIRRGPGFCYPRFFDNGLDIGKLILPEQIQQQHDLIERAKRIEIYTASQAPPRFNDNDGCGAVVIWTR